MLRYDLSRAMKRHRLGNANQLAVFAKIPPPLAYRLLSGEALKRIDVATLEKLARVFGVKPWTLLAYEAD
jgi:transcriptional regulator with XRE-family HTH domain